MSVMEKGIAYTGKQYWIKLKNILRNSGHIRIDFSEHSGRCGVLNQYIKTGAGIEIGALQNPMKVKKGVHVKYIDRFSVGELRMQYPELSKYKLVEVDVVADGETLEPFENSSQDFVIANHFLEHCENPILAINNMLRILKPRGILYMAIPDKHYSFDIDRPVTSYEHLLKDFKDGPQVSRRQHFEEWVRLVNKVTDNIEVEKQIKHLMEINYSIHFHVWTQIEMIELILKQNKKYQIGLIYKNVGEMIFVLIKS